MHRLFCFFSDLGFLICHYTAGKSGYSAQDHSGEDPCRMHLSFYRHKNPYAFPAVTEYTVTANLPILLSPLHHLYRLAIDRDRIRIRWNTAIRSVLSSVSRLLSVAPVIHSDKDQGNRRSYHRRTAWPDMRMSDFLNVRSSFVYTIKPYLSTERGEDRPVLDVQGSSTFASEIILTANRANITGIFFNIKNSST